ncbi:hypothetical protein KR222_000974 [Zaprionus bogoriensis]|nr:hypothetical protein KR222_000974 [Zaprionus bogoriensis]
MLLAINLPGFNCVRKGQDVGELLQDPKKRSQMYYDEEYLSELEYLLPRMLHQGYFEQL